jgi:lipopolysaccharide transport system permease protein
MNILQKKEREVVIINSNNNAFSLNVIELLKYRDLIYLLVSRDFKVFYKQTILGPFWYILQPLLNSSIFTIIFARIASLPTDNIPPFIFYMCGTIMWSYFSSCTMSVSQVFLSNKDLFSKIYFPRLVAPISTILINLLQFAIQFFILLCFILYFYFLGLEFNFSYKLFLLPLLLIQLAIMSIGFGCLFASITYKYKDLSILLSFGIQLWMFITPVIYPLSMVNKKYVILYTLNPVSSVIENFRYILFGNVDFNVLLTLSSISFSIIILFFGLYMFNKVQKIFMDTI